MSAFNQCLIDYKTILKKDYTTALIVKPTKAVFRKNDLISRIDEKLPFVI